MSKILAQDEVDALLRGLSGGEIETRRRGRGRRFGIVSFDLANQDRIIRGRMPVLEIVNDRFARLCTNALSNSVRKRVELNPISIDMTKFGDFMRSLPVPTSINIFKNGTPARQCHHCRGLTPGLRSQWKIFSAALAVSRKSKAGNLPVSNRPSSTVSSNWPGQHGRIMASGS